MQEAVEQQREQQHLVRALRAFVDALRAVKSASQAPEAIAAAIRALCCSVSGEDAAGGDRDREQLWRVGLVPALRRLSACTRRLDTLDAERPRVRGAKPEAPLGLLSLRDYAALQAALEVLVVWAALPRVATGVLLPPERRRPTKTLGIAPSVLLWGASRVQLTPDEGHSLLEVVRALLELLLLPQFRPVLLPTYVVELTALLVFGETCVLFAEEMQREFSCLCEQLLRALPLRLSMAGLRAALGQTTGADPALAPFKQRCGQLLSQLLLEDGGVMAAIDVLLSGVDEGNTQARMQVATLLCQCPSGLAPAAYARALSRQVKELLSPACRGSKLLCETAVLIADKIARVYPEAFATEFVAQLFEPLLLYEDTRRDAALVATEEQVLESVTLATLLICGPPPSQELLCALAPLVRPMLHMYSFAAMSKSELAQILQVTLVAWIKMCHGASAVLQVAVLPVTPPLPELVLASGKYERNRAAPWRRLREFCAGGTGGVALRIVAPDNEQQEEGDDDTMPLKTLVLAMTELLCAKELESSEVVGELFASLLLTYMQVRRSMGAVAGGERQHSDTSQMSSTKTTTLSLFEEAKIPTDASGVEMVLSLLLAIIESLGPSVLRSAGAILSCIGTVLETYNEAKKSIIDSIDEDNRGITPNATSNALIQEMRIGAEEVPNSDDDSADDGDEILTICLGVVMTILEAGASTRSDAEEAQLRSMLPVLEVLSQHPRPEIAELASDARVKILVRGSTQRENSNSRSDSSKSFDEALKEAQDDLGSSLVPLRARGVVTLTKLVRRSHQQRHDPAWTPRVQRLVQIFMAHLDDPESYVFLAAVQGLSTLSDAHPDVAIPLLVSALRDRSQSLERRIKLSEALLFSAKRCGEMLPKYAKVFVFAYLDCIRPPRASGARVHIAKRFQLIQEIGSEDKGDVSANSSDAGRAKGDEDDLVEATLRASCLSNLAEVCVLLQWSLQPFVVDVMTCVFGILQLEFDATQQGVTAVRRGAVFVLKYVVQLMGWKVLELMPEQLKPMYHTLKVVARTDKDAVVVFHAQKALAALDGVMRDELFPSRDEQDSAFGIASLRIIR